MLTRSFCCFRGISVAAERRLWRGGCLCWAHLPQTGRLLSPRKAADLAAQLPVLKNAIEGGVADVFLSRLPIGHRLRVWPHFVAGTTFLDVETTGLGPRDELTVVGLWRDGVMETFVRGRNLDELLRTWRQTTLLVTFNGTRFDWPVLARKFGLSVMPPHIDLMDEARAFGYAGGLKAIERKLGIERVPDEDFDGEQAAQLWRDYSELDDDASLTRLLSYNARDVLSLIVLARRILRHSIEGYPGPTMSIPALSSTPTSNRYSSISSVH